jgi:hypothetical protein
LPQLVKKKKKKTKQKQKIGPKKSSRQLGPEPDFAFFKI